MKKIIAMFLALVIVLSFSATAFAGTTPYTPEQKITSIEAFFGQYAQLIGDTAKSTFDALKSQAANWATLSAAEKAKLKLSLEKLFIEAKQLVLTKKAEIVALQLNLAEIKAEIKANNGELEAVVTDNKEIRAAIKVKLTALKAQEGYTLPAEVSAKFTELKALSETLAATKGEIKAIIEGNKTNIGNKDFPAIKVAFEQIVAIQESRLTTLTAINVLLDEINALLP